MAFGIKQKPQTAPNLVVNLCCLFDQLQEHEFFLISSIWWQKMNFSNCDQILLLIFRYLTILQLSKNKLFKFKALSLKMQTQFWKPQSIYWKPQSIYFLIMKREFKIIDLLEDLYDDSSLKLYTRLKRKIGRVLTISTAGQERYCLVFTSRCYF